MLGSPNKQAESRSTPPFLIEKINFNNIWTQIFTDLHGFLKAYVDPGKPYLSASNRNNKFAWLSTRPK